MSTTAKILVTVKLDPIPGWGHKVEDFVAQLRDNSGIPHYIESVEVVPDPYEEMKEALCRISRENVKDFEREYHRIYGGFYD